MATRTVNGWTFDDPEPIAAILYTWRIVVGTAVACVLAIIAMRAVLRDPIGLPSWTFPVVVIGWLMALSMIGVVRQTKRQERIGKDKVVLTCGLVGSSQRVRAYGTTDVLDGALVFVGRSSGDHECRATLGKDATSLLDDFAPKLLIKDQPQPIPGVWMRLDPPPAKQEELLAQFAQVTKPETERWPAFTLRQTVDRPNLQAWCLPPILGVTAWLIAIEGIPDRSPWSIALPALALGFYIGPGVFYLTMVSNRLADKERVRRENRLPSRARGDSDRLPTA